MPKEIISTLLKDLAKIKLIFPSITIKIPEVQYQGVTIKNVEITLNSGKEKI